MVCRAYGVGTDLPTGLDVDELVALMSRDKKVLGEGLTFVLDGPDGVEVVTGVSPVDVRATLEAAA